jgi:hypothetical protein
MTGGSRMAALLAWFALISCGPGKVVEECIPVDEEVGVGQYWCDAMDIYDPELEWEGPAPAQARFVCLAPDEAGECTLCGLDELAEAVEGGLREQLAIAAPECELERWEVHCMQSIEHGTVFGGPDQYCCYEIAIWGESCEP